MGVVVTEGVASSTLLSACSSYTTTRPEMVMKRGCPCAGRDSSRKRTRYVLPEKSGEIAKQTEKTATLGSD